jgi:hypothetical protein
LSAWGHDGNGHRRRSIAREVKAIDQDVKLNRALWHLSERMAKLKIGLGPAAAPSRKWHFGPGML